MNKRVRAIIFVILGVGLVGLGILAVSVLFRSGIARPARVEPTAVPEVKSQVVLTTRDLFLGDLIGQEDVILSDVPVEYVPRDAITEIEQVVNKYVKTDMVQGEMILQHNVADPTNINHDLAFTLSDNHVLYAFPAVGLLSSASIVQRGDIIDLVATYEIEVDTALLRQQQAAEGEEQEPEVRTITFDAYQATTITALVADIVQTEEQQQNPEEPVGPPTRGQIRIQGLLLAIPPQDALLLKHLVDTEANFDIVLRAPTNNRLFELTPVTAEYIKELYGFGILP